MSDSRQQNLVLYDTTLRDGAQGHGISYSLQDKLHITKLLDEFGITYIEGGWPGSNPKDAQYFTEVQQLPLTNSIITAFGCTRKANTRAEEDSQLAKLLACGAKAITLVGKSWDLHVTEVLRTSKEENLAMIEDSARLLSAAGREVIYDAEHFFDGFRANADYALACLQAAVTGGAGTLVLCDTNGGSLPAWISQVVTTVSQRFAKVKIGIHAHNDAELAVANALAAVNAGASHVQGTINGYGERCGNTNLIALVPSLQLKMGLACVGEQQLARLTLLAQQVSDLVNVPLAPTAAYVGSHAFAHKGGLHASAVAHLAASYEHINPELIGNQQQILISELSGRSNVRARAQKLDIDLGANEQQLLAEIKRLEHNGLSLEGADGSFELLCRRLSEQYQPLFKLIDFTVHSQGDDKAKVSSRVTVKMNILGNIELSVAEAQGPVHALDLALRRALTVHYPILNKVRLTDYKVRILNSQAAVAATTRVWLEAGLDNQRWATVACSDNILQASCNALLDSMELLLLRQQDR